MKLNIALVAQFLLLPLFYTVAFSQYQSRGKEWDYSDAELFFKNRKYYDALGLYQKLSEEYPKNLEYKLKKGICNIELNRAKDALVDIKSAKVKKKEPDNYSFYLARAYALNNQFDSAIIIFNEALNRSNVDKEHKAQIPHLIEQAKNGKEIIKNKLDVTIENLGAPVNTENNEYSPVVDANETMLVYTYRGEKSTGGRQNEYFEQVVNGNYYEDVFISYKKNGKWSTPEPISGEVNTQEHEASVSISSDGRVVYIYRDTENNSGDLFYITKKGKTWSDMKRLPINSPYWEGSLSVSPDGKFAIFSSDRPGGFGGLDLYYSKKIGTNKWSKPVNLGETINTPYDEDAPFIHSDGINFNFSSKGHNSMGGFDIFESRIIGEGKYMKPRSIGYPINTTADDIFFFITAKGNAYFSSTREGGKGQNDIYTINAEDVLANSPVMLVKGEVLPADSKIYVTDENGKKVGEYQPEEHDGSFQFYLPLGFDYNIKIKSEGKATKELVLNTKKLTTFTLKEFDIKLDDNSTQSTTIASSSKPFLADADNYKKFVKHYGNKEIQGLVYKIQIGAYQDPRLFKYKKWSRIGHVTKEIDSDGLTKFTIGNFKTFNKALKVVEKAKKIGDKDAFIKVYYNGERTSLNKLISRGVFDVSVL